MSDDNVLFRRECSGAQLTIEEVGPGRLLISIGGSGVRAGIALMAADLYDLSDWLEQHLDRKDSDKVYEAQVSYDRQEAA